MLAGLRTVATADRTVLVDDSADGRASTPVSALAVASGAVRIEPAGGLMFEPVGTGQEADYLGS